MHSMVGMQATARGALFRHYPAMERNNSMKTEVIGTEYDHVSFENAQKYLVASGYKMVRQIDGQAGSQEVRSIKYCKGELEVVLESETYIGVTLSTEVDELRRICDELAAWRE